MTVPALAQTLPTAEETLRQFIGRDADRAREQAIQQLFSMSPDGELTQAMAETIDQRLRAEQRAAVVAIVLANDLDADGQVSRAEIDRVRAVLSGRERSQLEMQILEIDTDSDGTLAGSEIAAWGANAAAESALRGRYGLLGGTAFMVFDADGNGVVVVDDILTTIDRVGTAAPPPNRWSGAEPASACPLPQPSPQAIPVYLGGYEGTAVSSVAVAGLDRETSFATLDIEEGTEPVYIVVGVYDAMILHVTGATDRVERLVGGSRFGLGVVGLPEEVVDLRSPADCRMPAIHEVESADGVQARVFLTGRLGREVRMIGHYGLGRVALPSGRNERAEPQVASGGLAMPKDDGRSPVTENGMDEIERAGSPNALQRTLLRFYPGGVRNVAPADVVTNGTAEAYDVLPQQAGLIQLVESGAVSIMRDGTYSIDKPIARFPAGLNGAHSVEFVLRRGVPMPAGSPGHSSVLIEETGECRGARC